jgi:hypothetical protein
MTLHALSHDGVRLFFRALYDTSSLLLLAYAVKFRLLIVTLLHVEL